MSALVALRQLMTCSRFAFFFSTLPDIQIQAAWRAHQSHQPLNNNEYLHPRAFCIQTDRKFTWGPQSTSNAQCASPPPKSKHLLLIVKDFLCCCLPVCAAACRSHGCTRVPEICSFALPLLRNLRKAYFNKSGESDSTKIQRRSMSIRL